ncbi:MAG: hypothetical protein JWM34_5069 [Ilumatobacteraceae bacterium]|nr:hypothetical protein [Ilumatobacteraceae bacterium]
MIDDTEIDERITASLQRLGDGVRVDDVNEFRARLVQHASGPTFRARRPHIVAIAATLVLLAGATAVLFARHTGSDRRTVAPATSSDANTSVATAATAVPPSTVDTTAASQAGTSSPGTESTTIMPAAPIGGRAEPASVWTGSEMIIWGGYQTSTHQTPDTIVQGRNDAGVTVMSDGAAFDPATMTWRVVPAAPIPGGLSSAAVWTGTEMIVVVTNETGALPDLAAAYNPTTNTWRQLPTPPLTAAAQPLSMVWTGTEAIAVGGVNTIATGAAYNPTTNTWRPIADAPGRLQPPLQQLVWTGSRALTILQPADGGIGATTAPAPTEPASSPDQTGASDTSPRTTVTPEAGKTQLAAYDPAADTWTITGTVESTLLAGTPGGPSAAVIIGARQSTLVDRDGGIVGTLFASMPAGAAFNSHGVWDEREVLGWDGGQTGTAFDPTTAMWRTFTGGGLTARFGPVIVWTGSEMLAWGGGPISTVGALNDGIIYHPPVTAAAETSIATLPTTAATSTPSAPITASTSPTNSSVPSPVGAPTISPTDPTAADAAYLLPCTDIEGDAIPGPIAGTSLTIISTALATRTPTIGVNDNPSAAPTDPIIGLAAVSTDGSTIAATIDRKGPDDIVVTSDHGATWTMIGTVADATHLAIAADGSRVAVSASTANGDQIDIFTLADGGHRTIATPQGTSAFDAITFATAGAVAAAIEQGPPSEFANPAKIYILDLDTEQWSSAPAETSARTDLVTSILRSGSTLSYTALDIGVTTVSSNARMLTIGSDGISQHRPFDLPQLPILINDNGNTITIAVADGTGTYHIDQLTSLLTGDNSRGTILSIGCTRPGAAPDLNADPDKS